MPLATAALDAPGTRRVTAAAIAVALQGVFYWLILREAVEPTALPSAPPLEVTILEPAARHRPATVRQPEGRRTQRPQPAKSAAQERERASPPAEVSEPITPPRAAAPGPPPAIDWQRALRAEVRARESRSAGGLQFGLPGMPAPAPAAPKFGWDYAATHRLQMLPSGGTLINLTDRCGLVFYVLLIPVCKIGSIPTNGQLFDHLHDPGNDRTDGLP